MEIGRARDEGTGTLTSAGREWSYRKLNVGNPQCVVPRRRRGGGP